MTTSHNELSATTVPVGVLRLCLAAAVVAPVLLLIASLIGIAAGGWTSWAISGWAGGVQLLAYAGYALAFVGFALVLAPGRSGLASAVLVIGALVAAAGAGFGVDLIAGERFGERIPMPPEFSPGSAILAFTGILSAVVFVLIGIALYVARLVPAWLGILVAIGGVLFPAGRIPRVPALILASDVLLLVGLLLLVARLWPRTSSRPDPSTSGS